ncbi:MAG: PH domain-containing protein [Nanohaloarchaea archaeon]|nr:PH domain-containing protein [Candidatus Nanohaloarchaea archaeon]
MKLSKLSIPYKAAQKAGTLVLVLAFGGSASLQSLLIAVFLFIVLGTAILVYEYLYWRNYNYEITEDTFDIRSGVFQKRKREIPIHRIQNVDISRNVVIRLLGLSQVNLETAGGGSTEASIKFVGLQEARDIQKKVRRLKRDEKQQVDDEDEELLFEMDMRELLVMCAFSVKARAIVGLGLLFSVAGGFMGSAIEGTGVGITAGLLITATLSVFAVWLFSAASSFIQYFDFKLYRRDDALEYERGLLSRSSGSIPFKKIQTVSFEENPLKRIFGYSTVKIETAGYSAETAAEKGAEAAIPLAKRDRAINLARKIRGYENLEFKMYEIPKRAMHRYMGRYAVIWSSIMILGFTLKYFASGVRLILPGLLVLVIPPAAYFKWKNRGFGTDEEFFYSMNGFWNRRITVTPYFRVQNLMESQNIFQARFRLSNLTLDTAGSGILGNNPKAFDLDVNKASELRKSVFEKFEKSLYL